MAHNNLGLGLCEQGNFGEAALSFRQALSVDPTFVEAHYHLGLTHFKMRQPKEAIRCYQQTLRLDPRHVAALNNLGNAVRDQGEFAAAAACYEQVLKIEPENKITLYNRSILRLLHGDFAGAWSDFELRLEQPDVVARTFEEPRWNGSPLAGKTILVYDEQGLGDSLQFLRYLPLVQRLGGRVLFECHAALVDLARAAAGIDQIFARTASGMAPGLPPFDLQVPLLSLPGIFGTTLDTIPAHVPYLTADPKLIAHWADVLQATKPTKRVGALEVGILWQGNPHHRHDYLRSIPLEQFASLAGVAGTRLVSLQIGPGRQQLASQLFPVVDLGSGFNPSSLGDLAAAMMCLDIIVTIDSAVAHLAGALGRPVWVTLPAGPDWRWQLGRRDTPWYPTMRLFRQERAGDWSEVFAQIAAELKHLLASRPG